AGGQGPGREASADLDDWKTDRAEGRRGRDEGLAFRASPSLATLSSVRESAKPSEAVDTDEPQTRKVRDALREIECVHAGAHSRPLDAQVDLEHDLQLDARLFRRARQPLRSVATVDGASEPPEIHPLADSLGRAQVSAPCRAWPTSLRSSGRGRAEGPAVAQIVDVQEYPATASRRRWLALVPVAVVLLVFAATLEPVQPTWRPAPGPAGPAPPAVSRSAHPPA